MSILLLGAGLGATQTRLLDYAPGASAAYSLRQVGRQYNGPVVRVRRASDNTERNFTASEINSGTLASWVNSTPALPLDQSSGAAAAYSLRNLSSAYGGNVIRARRASDNDERNFNANEIIDGTLTTWTNASVALPLDEASGAAAAYSLRNLSASYTGDVIRVRRSGDNVELDFSASEITDGTLESWVIAGGGTENGYVKTWYDQSGNDRHATQTTAGYQPKIVSSGGVVTEEGKPAIQFDGTDDYLTADSVAAVVTASFPSVSIFCVLNSDETVNFPVAYNIASSLSNTPFIVLYTRAAYLTFQARDNSSNTAYLTPAVPPSGQYITSDIINSATHSAHVNGALLQSVSHSMTAATLDYFSIGAIRRFSGIQEYYGGTMQEMLIYPSDLTSQRTAIEANLAEFYGIDLPAGVDTANNEVDAFVTTWYDQSGNGNHAVQSTATKQPKIMSSGVLVTQNGKPTMRFDGVDDTMLVTPYDAEDGLLYLSRFAVVEKIGAAGGILTTTSDDGINLYGGARFFNTLSNSLEWAAGNSGFTVTSVNVTDVGYGLVSNGLHLISSIYDGTESTVSDAITPFLDGNSPTPTSTTGSVISPLLSGSTRLHIGSNVGSNNFWNGNIAEYIIYPSDKSDFRQGIETNTALYYNIFTTMKYKVQSNEVDGYVATWYDQSGNGYNAAQTTADYQPKLVSAGALITDGDEPAIEFDGTNDKLAVSDSTVLDLPATVFVVLTHSSSTATERYIFGRQLSAANGGVVIRQQNVTERVELLSVDAASPYPSVNFLRKSGRDVVAAIASPTDSSIYSSFVLEDTDNSASGFVNASHPAAIGGRPDANSNYWDSKIQEIIVYPFDQSSQRQRIEGNIAWEYGLQDRLPWNHPYAISFPGYGSQRVPTDTDAIAYLTAVSEADGVGVEVPVANAINDFIVGCKNDGIWDAIKASCILAGARSLDGALVPLVGAAPTNLPVANGFVGGDYSRTAGLKGDGTSYLDSGYAFPAELLNDMHLSGYVSEQPASLGGFFSSSYVSSGSFLNITLNSAATEANAVLARNPFSGAVTISVADANGFIGASRENASTVDIRAGDTQEEDASGSQGVTALNQYVFARNTVGTPNNFFTGRIAFYSFGESVDLEALDTRVSNLINTMGFYFTLGLNPENYDQDTINYIYNAYKAGGSLA